ncbi:fatty acyl-AMP ligase [bacterium]|nr:MAG: fatty acyl-AMP ligase [bacterium]
MNATITETLRQRAQIHPNRRALTFLLDGENETETLTYAELDNRVRSLAAILQARGASRQRVLLLFPSGLEYVCAFFACLYAGAVAVPLYPPRPHREDARLNAVIHDCQPALVLTTASLLPRLESLFPDVPCLALDAAKSDPARWQQPAHSSENLAFLQYTSGSTSTPKGVMVTHANVLSNHRMIATAFEQTEDYTIVSWLPLFHDMGLIGNLLQGVLAGNHCVLMPPEAFLMKPIRWLRAIQNYSSQASGAPNFAYDLCARKITPEQRADLDLSAWQLAFCGAEPVRAPTLNRFAELFATNGFQNSAFYPCYGLAEATLFASGGAKSSPPTITHFTSDSLENHCPQPANSLNESARPLVSCGQSWQGAEILIIDPESRVPCEPGSIGEIWIRGPHITDGYWNRPAETSSTFAAHTANGEGPYLRTGDLGFFHNGELFPTGRLKDLIIIGGRNHSPTDIEATVATSHPAIRAGACAAFGLEIENIEVLAVVAELERSHLNTLDSKSIIQSIRQSVAEKHDLRAHTIQLIRPATLPKTSSGKVQRHTCRHQLIAGTLSTIEPLT